MEPKRNHGWTSMELWRNATRDSHPIKSLTLSLKTGFPWIVSLEFDLLLFQLQHVEIVYNSIIRTIWTSLLQYDIRCLTLRVYHRVRLESSELEFYKEIFPVF
jgi:hypothetical protein